MYQLPEVIILKKVFLVLLIFLLAFSLSACNENSDSSYYESESDEISNSEEIPVTEDTSEPEEEYEYSEKDAQNLVQWNLDVIYFGTLSKEGAESFGMTSEAVEYEHMQTILYEAENLYMLVGEDKYIEDAFEKCFYIMNNIYAQADYTVNEAIKIDESHFEIEIDVRPIMFNEYLSSGFANAIKEHPELESADLSEEDFEKQVAEIIFEVFENFSNNIEYGDPVTVNATVEQGPNGNWEIEEKDFNKLIDTIIMS